MVRLTIPRICPAGPAPGRSPQSSLETGQGCPARIRAYGNNPMTSPHMKTIILWLVAVATLASTLAAGMGG